MGITGFTLPTMYRWIQSDRGRSLTMHPFMKGHFLGSGQAEMVLAEDDTFVLNMQVVVPMSGAKEDIVAKGTWKLEGDQFTITTIEENGVANATPDVKVATYKDGLISIRDKYRSCFGTIALPEFCAIGPVIRSKKQRPVYIG